MRYKGIIKENKAIYKALVLRKKELKLTLVDIVKDAKVLGMHILLPSLSKYFTKSEENNLTEEAIIWLCKRYGVSVVLCIGEGFGGVHVDAPIGPYDEKKCLRDLRKRFPEKRIRYGRSK